MGTPRYRGPLSKPAFGWCQPVRCCPAGLYGTWSLSSSDLPASSGGSCHGHETPFVRELTSPGVTMTIAGKDGVAASSDVAPVMRKSKDRWGHSHHPMADNKPVPMDRTLRRSADRCTGRTTRQATLARPSARLSRRTRFGIANQVTLAGMLNHDSEDADVSSQRPPGGAPIIMKGLSCRTRLSRRRRLRSTTATNPAIRR